MARQTSLALCSWEPGRESRTSRAGSEGPGSEPGQGVQGHSASPPLPSDASWEVFLTGTECQNWLPVPPSAMALKTVEKEAGVGQCDTELSPGACWLRGIIWGGPRRTPRPVFKAHLGVVGLDGRGCSGSSMGKTGNHTGTRTGDAVTPLYTSHR